MKRLIKLKRFLLSKSKNLNEKRKTWLRKTLVFIQEKPFTSFFVVLGILLVLMIVGNVLFSPKPEVINSQKAPKKIQTYKIGNAPLVLSLIHI